MAASAAAPASLPRFIRTLARPTRARFTISSAPAAPAPSMVRVNRSSASAKISSGLISGPRSMVAEHMASPRSVRLYPAKAAALAISWFLFGTCSELQASRRFRASSAIHRAVERGSYTLGASPEQSPVAYMENHPVGVNTRPSYQTKDPPPVSPPTPSSFPTYPPAEMK